MDTIHARVSLSPLAASTGFSLAPRTWASLWPPAGTWDQAFLEALALSGRSSGRTSGRMSVLISMLCFYCYKFLQDNKHKLGVSRANGSPEQKKSYKKESRRERVCGVPGMAHHVCKQWKHILFCGFCSLFFCGGCFVLFCFVFENQGVVNEKPWVSTCWLSRAQFSCYHSQPHLRMEEKPAAHSGHRA